MREQLQLTGNISNWFEEQLYLLEKIKTRFKNNYS